MLKKMFKKFLSLSICFSVIISSFVYADTVIIGAAPTTNKTVSNNVAAGSYITNQYTGPGNAPTSATNYGTSPIQVNYSAGQKAASIDANGVGTNGPVTTSISAPTANKNLNTSQSAIIMSGGATTTTTQQGVKGVNVADGGPTSVEVSGPTAPATQGGLVSINGSGPLVNNSGKIEGNVYNADVNVSQYPSNGTTNQVTSAMNNDTIIYQSLANITTKAPTIKSPAAIVVNATSRKVYYAKGGFTTYPPAALANLVTAYLLVTHKGLEDVITVSANAVNNLESGASVAGLKAGDTIKVKDAIAAMFVSSCCDVSNAVAESVSGNIANFVSLMNTTARNWGCIGTVFTNPTGLNNDNQVTNTYDMAIVMDKVSQNEILKVFLQQTKYSLPATASRKEKVLTTKNELITKGTKGYYAGVTASKMGYTSKAKYTLAAEIDNNNQRLIAVILKSDNTHYSDMKLLLDYAKKAQAEEISRYGVVKELITNNANTNVATSITTNTSYAGTTTGVISTASTDTNGSWQQDAKGWYFIKENGQKANNEWVRVNGKLYCVDSTSYMITGWREFSNGKYYYFDPTNGEFRYNTWVNTDNGAYYLQSDGSLARAEKGQTKNITTSVGTYTIDENGRAVAKVK